MGHYGPATTAFLATAGSACTVIMPSSPFDLSRSLVPVVNSRSNTFVGTGERGNYQQTLSVCHCPPVSKNRLISRQFSGARVSHCSPMLAGQRDKPGHNFPTKPGPYSHDGGTDPSLDS